MSVLAVNVPQGQLRVVVTVFGVLLSSMLGMWLLHRRLHGRFRRLPASMMSHRLRTACGVLFAVGIIPVAVGILANILVLSQEGVADIAEQVLVRRYTQLASPLLWFAIIAFSFRKYWRKPEVVS